MATGYGVCVHIVYGYRAISSTRHRGQPGVNPYRDCAEIVRKSCNVSAVAVQSPKPPHGNRTEPMRGSAFARCPCGIVDCHLRHVYGLRAFSKIFKLLAKPNRRGRGARESVRKSHSRLLSPQGGLAGAARKRGYGQDTGSVYPSQAKCERGIRRDGSGGEPELWHYHIQVCHNVNIIIQNDRIRKSYCLLHRYSCLNTIWV